MGSTSRVGESMGSLGGLRFCMGYMHFNGIQIWRFDETTLELVD
jgi:hypothetical protein